MVKKSATKDRGASAAPARLPGDGCAYCGQLGAFSPGRPCPGCGLIPLACPGPAAPFTFPVELARGLLTHFAGRPGRLLATGAVPGLATWSESAGWKATVLDRPDLAALRALPAGQLDVVALFDCLEYVPEPRAWLDELARLLGPAGVALVATPAVEAARPGQRFRLTPSFLRRALAERVGGTARRVSFEADNGRCEVMIGYRGVSWPARRRVLFVNRGDGLALTGGDIVQEARTGRALEPLGYAVDHHFGPEPTGADVAYDLGHVFNTLIPDEALRQVAALRGLGVPVLLSTIYWPDEEATWIGHVVRHAYAESADDAALAPYLDAIRDRAIAVDGRLPRVGRDWDPEHQRQQRQLVHAVDHLLPNSRIEMREIARNLGQPRQRFTVVTNAVDPGIFVGAKPDWFVQTHRWRDFVCVAGRIDQRKNQLLLFSALRQVGLPLVVLGSSYHAWYETLARRWAPPWTLFTGGLAPEQLASAFAAARVHVLPSWFDTPGLVNLEAALADCTLVVGNRAAEWEYFGEEAYYCDPGDVASIRDAVLAAYLNYERDAPRRARLRDRILREHTWDVAARATAAAYETVLEDPHLGQASRTAEPPRVPPPSGGQCFAVFATPGDPAYLGMVAAYLNAFRPEDGARLVIFLDPTRAAQLPIYRDELARQTGARPDLLVELAPPGDAWLAETTALLATGPLDTERARQAAAAGRSVAALPDPGLLRLLARSYRASP